MQIRGGMLQNKLDKFEIVTLLMLIKTMSRDTWSLTELTLKFALSPSLGKRKNTFLDIVYVVGLS